MNIKALKNAGALLYACEGTKLRRDRRGENRWVYAIEITNSSPEIIALFCRFLNEVLKVEKQKLRGQLFIYKDHDKTQLIEYWSKVSGIPIEQFQKVIMLKQKNSRYKPNPLGTFKVRYNKKEDFLRLQKIIKTVWIEGKVNQYGRVA